ncbi:MAG: hypothetical protein GOVbin707_6 [Prokaryotic dsDNA virus sp.]|nr:MAG: hypothetical protein GOVbin707_6 [Prokaryotic dsDNA virus sp.]|tara:strand:+ start:9745 stop:9951 length:207 start_codon:yes stop_codon:yes gene_type:complete
MKTCKCCKVNKDIEEDMTLITMKRLKEHYEFANVLSPYADKLLCDDCYTELRYYIADELDIELSEVEI